MEAELQKRSSKTNVRKRNGSLQPFTPMKMFQSIRNAGASREEATKVTSNITKRVSKEKEVPSSKLSNMVSRSLGQFNKKASSNFRSIRDEKFQSAAFIISPEKRELLFELNQIPLNNSNSLSLSEVVIPIEKWSNISYAVPILYSTHVFGSFNIILELDKDTKQLWAMHPERPRLTQESTYLISKFDSPRIISINTVGSLSANHMNHTMEKSEIFTIEVDENNNTNLEVLGDFSYPIFDLHLRTSRENFGMNKGLVDVRVKGTLKLSSYFTVHYETNRFDPISKRVRVTERDKKSFPDFIRTRGRGAMISMKDISLVLQGKLVLDANFYPFYEPYEPEFQSSKSIPIELTTRLGGSGFTYFKE